jgi:Spy/CpxP family protein refolding chaperone
MRKSLIGVFLGFIVITAAALNADAQPCGCMDGPGAGMQGNGMMMEQPGHKDMGMMQGMGGGMHGGGMMMDDDHPMWRHLMGLGLDDKQKDALKALRTRMRKDMARKNADKQIARIELEELLDKDPVDMKAVEASVKKSESIKTEMLLAHIRAHEEMKSILTPEQRKRFKEMMEMGRGAGGMGCGMMSGMMKGDAEHKGVQQEANPRLQEHAH